MKVSVILGHPYQKSFNSAIAEVVVKTLEKNGHTILFHNLYQENFNPVMPEDELVSDSSKDKLVVNHQQEIKEAEGIIIIHPNWWGQPPSILKGWLDRVLRENVAYRYPEGEGANELPIGLLKAKAGLVFNTSNTSESCENTVYDDPLNKLWKDCVFHFCGVSTFDRIMFRVIANSTENQRKEWLHEAGCMTDKYFPAAEYSNESTH